MAWENQVKFFLANAGYSWNPKTETETEGRQRSAESLAKAEDWALDNGYSFDWREDDLDSSEFSDERPAWTLWQCTMFNASGEIVQELGGIDFGRDGSPWGDSYRRAVEAELALEQMP